jgi:hypothetical protein
VVIFPQHGLSALGRHEAPPSVLAVADEAIE